MKKRFFEVKETLVGTVEDLINALMEVPKGYTVHPMGKEFSVAIDHYNGCICVDDPKWIEDREYELKEDIKDSGDGPEDGVFVNEEYGFDIEVPDEKLETYSPNLCVVMGYIDLCQNGNYEAQLMGVFSKDEVAKECGDELVEAEVVHHYEIEHPLLDEFGYK